MESHQLDKTYQRCREILVRKHSCFILIKSYLDVFLMMVNFGR